MSESYLCEKIETNGVYVKNELKFYIFFLKVMWTHT
jgi:hypothetical protein